MAIVVIVDGSGSGIEPMVPMAGSPKVVAVVCGGKDGVFTTNSHNNDCHPSSPLDEDRTAGWRACRDVTHLSLPRYLSLVLHLRDDGAKDNGRGDRQGRHAYNHSREEVEHHDPIGVEQQ